MKKKHVAILILLGAMVLGIYSAVHASDLYNPKKRYFVVFHQNIRNGNCQALEGYSRYYPNGKDAYWAKAPAGYKKYVAWCWRDGSGNCDKTILTHMFYAFCKNFGCRRAVYNGRTI